MCMSSVSMKLAMKLVSQCKVLFLIALMTVAFFFTSCNGDRVEELEAELQRCQDELEQCQDELEQCQNELEQCQGELEDCEDRILLL